MLMAGSPVGLAAPVHRTFALTAAGVCDEVADL